MSLFFCSLSSGSSGNCQYIATGEKKFLVDAGFTGKRIEFLLKEIRVNPGDLDGIIVTHEHRDHVQGVGVLARRHKIPIYATAATWAAMAPIIKEVPQHLVRILDREKTHSFGDLGIYALPTHHDAVDPMGYIFQWRDRKLSLVTDTGWLSPDMLDAMEGSHVYYIEANHDEEMLRDGAYPWSLKQRILGTRGHMSNAHTGVYLQRLVKGKGERVILAHLSQDNNSPRLAFQEVEKSLLEFEMKLGENYHMTVAKRHALSGGILLEE